MEDAEIQAERACDGEQCISMLEEADSAYYDAILMDIQMPHKNGYQAPREIRQMPDKIKSNIPIIAMTANAFQEDKKKALNAGMNSFIPKPIDISHLIKILAQTLQEKQREG